MTSDKSIPRFAARLASISPTRWLLYAAILHFITTLAVFLAGHFQLLASTFDQHGTGLGFAMDGIVYRGVIDDLSETFLQHGISAWADLQAPLHCRLYSLSFIILGRLIGYNILAAEPLNLLYYLAILILVYSLAKTLFNSCAGLIAAGLVAVWPTFLLHSTQLLRDSLSIALMLALLWLLVVVLQRTLSWPNTLLICVSSVALLIVFWLTRGNFWNVVLAACALALVLLIVRAVRESKLLLSNFIVVLVMLAATLLVPTRIDSTTLALTNPPSAVIVIPSGQPTSSRSMWSRMVTQIRARRGGFIIYGAQASNIDSQVQFKNAWDIVKYVPRAAVIGFFAPFPRMWFEAGTGGRGSRLISGAETLVMYLLYIMAVWGLWSERRKVGVWLVFLLTTISVTALGLVVLNAGALYRLRYVFWIMVMVLAAQKISERVGRVADCKLVP